MMVVFYEKRPDSNGESEANEQVDELHPQHCGDICQRDKTSGL